MTLREVTFRRLVDALRYRKDIRPCGDPPYDAHFFAQAGISGIEFGTVVTAHPEGLAADLEHLKNKDVSTQLNSIYQLGEFGHFLRVDIQEPLPLADACVDWVFAEHIIEHVSPQAAIGWLAEVRRILRPGGLLRIVTPDLAKYIAGYTSGDFFTTHSQSLEDEGLPPMPDRPAFMMNQIFYLWGHRWIYDRAELAHALTEAGFAPGRIAACEFGQGCRADVAALDRAWRKGESLYLEVVR